MNKKQARKLNQRRKKVHAANERQSIRNAEESRQEAMRRQQLAKFKVAPVAGGRMEYLANYGNAATCLFCDEKITKKDLKARQFLALQASTNRTREYFVHMNHFYADGVPEMSAGGEANFAVVYERIARRELGDWAVAA